MTAADWRSMFQALGNVYRRRLLLSLLEHNPQNDTLQIPEDVNVGDSDPAELQTKLVHTHLPTLEAYGYIRWDRESHQVEKGPTFDEIRPLLEVLKRHRDKLPDGWR